MAEWRFIMPEFSENQFKTMQEDAIGRVREMQRRSQEKLRQSNEILSSNPPSNSTTSSNANSSNPSSSENKNNNSTPNNRNRNNNRQTNRSPNAPNFGQTPKTNTSTKQNFGGNTNSNKNNYATYKTPLSVNNAANALNINSNSLFADFNLDKESGIILLLIFLLVKEKASTPLILSLCYLLL